LRNERGFFAASIKIHSELCELGASAVKSRFLLSRIPATAVSLPLKNGIQMLGMGWTPVFTGVTTAPRHDNPSLCLKHVLSTVEGARDFNQPQERHQRRIRQLKLAYLANKETCALKENRTARRPVVCVGRAGNGAAGKPKAVVLVHSITLPR
jgi:hypothetical protein